MKKKFRSKSALCYLCSLWASIALFTLTGCKTDEMQTKPVDMTKAAKHTEIIILREGDVINITFPGAPSLNATQPIRRDGKVVLQDVGEIQAAGMTPTELEKEIGKLYEGKLLAAQDVVVTVQSSTFPVFVTGAVLRPGKVLSDHPMTALEAIMEAGGFNYSTANMKAVVIIRNENGYLKHYVLNLKAVMDGTQSTNFYLKSGDTVWVREKFSLL